MAIVIHIIKGRKYAYRHIRKGKKVISEYLGPVKDEATKDNYQEETRPALHSGGPSPEYREGRETDIKKKEAEKLEAENKKFREKVKQQKPSPGAPAASNHNINLSKIYIPPVLLQDKKPEDSDLFYMLKMEKPLTYGPYSIKWEYDKTKHAQAQAYPWDNKIIIGPSIYDSLFSKDARKHIIYHELGHFYEHDILKDNEIFQYLHDNNIFGESKTNKKGTPYYDGIYGGYNISESVAEAIAVYMDEPEDLKTRHPKAYMFIDNFFTGKKLIPEAKPAQEVKPEKPETWDFKDSTHPDAIYFNGSGFTGGKNLSDQDKLKWHNSEIEDLKRQLGELRNKKIIGNDAGSKAKRSLKGNEVKQLLKIKNLHENELKKLKIKIKQDWEIKKIQAKNAQEYKYKDCNFKILESSVKFRWNKTPLLDAYFKVNPKPAQYGFYSLPGYKMTSSESEIKEMTEKALSRIYENIDNFAYDLNKAQEAKKPKEPKVKKPREKKEETENSKAVLNVKMFLKQYYRNGKFKVSGNQKGDTNRVYVEYERGPDIRDGEQAVYNILSTPIYGRYTKIGQIPPDITINGFEFDREGFIIQKPKPQVFSDVDKKTFMLNMIGSDYKDFTGKNYYIAVGEYAGEKVKFHIPKSKKQKAGVYYLVLQTFNNEGGFLPAQSDDLIRTINQYGFKASKFKNAVGRYNVYLLPE